MSAQALQLPAGVEAQVLYRGGYVQFRAVTTFRPTRDQLGAWQSKLGYDPATHGGPGCIHTHGGAWSDGAEYVTDWRCYGGWD